jgi:hypothetical protein
MLPLKRYCNGFMRANRDGGHPSPDSRFTKRFSLLLPVTVMIVQHSSRGNPAPPMSFTSEESLPFVPMPHASSPLSEKTPGVTNESAIALLVLCF